MRGFVFFAAAMAAALLSAPASAQQDALGASAAQLYDTCIRNGQGGQTECACMAGFYGGRLQEDEFRLLAALNQHIDNTGNVPDMAAAQQSLIDQRNAMGLSDARFDQAMQRFSSMDQDGLYGDRICVPLRNR